MTNKTLFICISIFVTLTGYAQTKKIKNINSKEIWIDRFELKGNKSILTTEWFTYTDKANNGNSEVWAKKITRDQDSCFQINYKFDKGTYKWDPYIAAGLTVMDSLIKCGLGDIKGISYDYKGKRHSIVYQLSTVKDYANYQRFVPESEEWTTIIIPLTELKQPMWGRGIVFEQEKLQALNWIVFGRTGVEDTLYIDNIKFLRVLPKEFTKNETKK